MDMNAERWRFTSDYLRDVFGQQDEHLAGLMPEAVARGLPNIAVSAEVGRLLMILVSMAPQGTAIEVGTLGGYSGIWIARGLGLHGRLITIEPNPLHADLAAEQFQKAGVADRIEIRRGTGLAILPQLARELGPASVNFVFLDAVKEEYPEYWRILRPMIAVGGLVTADNVCGSDSWWIDDADHPSRQGADAFNRLIAADPDFEAVATPLRNGVLIGRRMR